MINKIIQNIQEHENYMNSNINLIASENRLSYLTRESLMSDYGNRVAEGWADQRLFPGLKYYDEIEEYGISLIKEMFKADFADIRPISGTMANMVVYTAFTKPGDTILATSINDGGHISMSGATPKKVFDLDVRSVPMIENEINVIDVEKTVTAIHEYKPKLVILGGSVLIKKLDVYEVYKAAHEENAITIFDASHVSGLIVGGEYPNPFDEGADIITTSTCKTIPGPQHGFVLAKNPYGEMIKKATFPALHSGHHLHHTVASIITMYEMSQFGKEYAKQIRKNIVCLADSLNKKGFNLYSYDDGKYTDTHMIMLLSNNAIDDEKHLEKAGIIVNKNLLPWDKSFKVPSGIRIGTPEVTRLGMKEKNMSDIADFMYRILILNEDVKKVREEVREYASQFNDIFYCYRDTIWQNS